MPSQPEMASSQALLEQVLEFMSMSRLAAGMVRGLPKAHARIKPARVVLHVALTIGALVMLFPIVWMFLSAFKTEAEVNAYPPTFWPRQPTLQSVIDAWNRLHLLRLLRNSLFLASVITPVSVLTSTWIGFVLAKYEFPGRDIVFLAIMSTFMSPASMLLIPRYQMAVWLGLVNKHAGVIIPGLLTPFGIFLMRQSMHALPADLLEAARIDGSSEPRILVQIVMPLVRPAMSALAVFVFLGVWEDLLWPLVILNDQRLFTVELGLALLRGEIPTHAVANAAASIVVLPVIAVFLVFQRHIIRSVAMTGMGGT